MRYMPHSVTGDSADDLAKVVPSDCMGDATLAPYVQVSP